MAHIFRFRIVPFKTGMPFVMPTWKVLLSETQADRSKGVIDLLEVDKKSQKVKGQGSTIGFDSQQTSATRYALSMLVLGALCRAS